VRWCARRGALAGAGCGGATQSGRSRLRDAFPGGCGMVPPQPPLYLRLQSDEVAGATGIARGPADPLLCRVEIALIEAKAAQQDTGQQIEEGRETRIHTEHAELHGRG